jgi:hypothetical protein
MTRFGYQHLDVGVFDVTSEMLVTPGVVEPDQSRPYQPRPAQGKDVVRGVVKEDTDVGRPSGIESPPVQGSKSSRLLQKFPVRPDPVTEPEGRSVGAVGVTSISLQESGDVGCGKRDLVQRWGVDDRLTHMSRHRPPYA